MGEVTPEVSRNEMAKDYPKPSSQAVSVPELNRDIKGALGKEVPDKSDAQLAKIQASILATSAPLANYWSHLEELDLSGTGSQVLVDVVTIIRHTLALIGNASNYISQIRCSALIQSISKSCPKLGSFMKEICKEDLVTTGSDLFGPEVRKITERANTIEAFNKAIASVEGTSSQKTNTSSRFLSKRPTVKYGGRSDRSRYNPYNKFRQPRRYGEATKSNPQNQFQKRQSDPK